VVGVGEEGLFDWVDDGEGGLWRSKRRDFVVRWARFLWM
jgi:hypothetical protein